MSYLQSITYGLYLSHQVGSFHGVGSSLEVNRIKKDEKNSKKERKVEHRHRITQTFQE